MLLWVAISVLALVTWSVDPRIQHVLQAASGGLWGTAVLASFARIRRDQGWPVSGWALAIIGVPVVFVIAAGVALTWELLSPLAVPTSAPLRLLEAWVATSLAQVGRGASSHVADE